MMMMMMMIFFFLVGTPAAMADKPLMELVYTSDELTRASVVVACRANKKTSKVRGKTDPYGDFLIDLPSHLHAIPNMENRCIVRIVGVPKKSLCHRAFAARKHKAGRIKLSSSSPGDGIRTYSVGHGIHLARKQHSHPLITMNRGRKML
ncbi:Pollen Ole e 1 allergen/extensin [Cynara cardunculus var. scolymus]|uniref:Pollen Ole e 1 allergen/extensin n=1 Tax=Cynara cardunculus var. scolymus TaxID=59895 RepID=A0A103XD66_CYNCS|nr:Pollen Ole e 1 allergen/extensin [Cynara cardunculus var. scolymus]